MTKQKQKEQLFIIATLSLKELQEKEEQISMSMLDSKTKNILYKAIHLSRVNDLNYDVVDSMAVASEIKEVS